MPPQSVSRTVSADPPSQNSRSPSVSGRDMAHVKQEARDDTGGLAAQPSSPSASNSFLSAPSSPATHTPASDPNHNQPVSMYTAPVHQHSLAEYYRNGLYSDLEIVSNGVVRSVHKIVVCSESPVLKIMCSLGYDRLELNQYDPDTLDRVLDFCYRRTYSDGEFPETVAPFLTRMTAADVREALRTPFVASDVDDPEGWASHHGPENSEETQHPGGEEDPDEEEDLDEEHQFNAEQDRMEDTSEYVPYSYDIHYALEFESDTEQEFDMEIQSGVEDQSRVENQSDTSNDGVPSVGTPLTSPSPMDIPQPPYAISLLANFKVYVAAKELQIPALQLVARVRFAHSLCAHWTRFADLPPLAEQVYLQTDENDPIRTLMYQIVAVGYANDDDTVFKAGIIEVMARNGEFATGVLDAVLRLRRVWAWNA